MYDQRLAEGEVRRSDPQEYSPPSPVCRCENVPGCVRAKASLPRQTHFTCQNDEVLDQAPWPPAGHMSPNFRRYPQFLIEFLWVSELTHFGILNYVFCVQIKPCRLYKCIKEFHIF